MEALLLFVAIIVLLLIGVPIAVALGVSSIMFLLILSDSSLASIAQTMFSAFDGHDTLLAIPFFILASSFMSTGGVAARIIRFSIACGGIYSGIFTPTEAAAVAAVYAFLIANFVYRDMGDETTKHSLLSRPQALITAFFHKDTRKTLADAGKLTITLLFIIANALILKHVLTDEQIPQAIAGAMLEAGFGPVMFLIIVNVILLIGGQFMEPSGLIVIVAPLVFPIAIDLGIDPIHLGIIMVVNMEIGMITPPVGLNLFVTSGVAGMPMMSVVKAAAPFLAILFIFLIIVTYVPWLSTVIPNAMMGPEIVTR